MSKRSINTRHLRNEKFKEFVKRYCKVNGVECTDIIKVAFDTGFNIGYTISRDIMRNNIDDTFIYDWCKACDCLSLVNRETGLCADCTLG